MSSTVQAARLDLVRSLNEAIVWLTAVQQEAAARDLTFDQATNAYLTRISGKTLDGTKVRRTKEKLTGRSRSIEDVDAIADKAISAIDFLLESPGAAGVLVPTKDKPVRTTIKGSGRYSIREQST